MKKRTLAILSALCMLFALLPTTTFAETAKSIYAVSYGHGVVSADTYTASAGTLITVTLAPDIQELRTLSDVQAQMISDMKFVSDPPTGTVADVNSTFPDRDQYTDGTALDSDAYSGSAIYYPINFIFAVTNDSNATEILLTKVNDTTYTFTMPDADVKIGAGFGSVTTEPSGARTPLSQGTHRQQMGNSGSRSSYLDYSVEMSSSLRVIMYPSYVENVFDFSEGKTLQIVYPAEGEKSTYGSILLSILGINKDFSGTKQISLSETTFALPDSISQADANRKMFSVTGDGNGNFTVSCLLTGDSVVTSPYFSAVNSHEIKSKQVDTTKFSPDSIFFGDPDAPLFHNIVSGYYYVDRLTTVSEYKSAVSFAFRYGSSASQHSVTVQNDGNGGATASTYRAAAGTTVTLYAAPNQGYHFKEWQVVNGNAAITENSFTMPDSNITVKAVFEEDVPMPSFSRIATLPCANGSISADKTDAIPGDTIHLTVSPDAGYRLRSIQVLDDLGQDLVQEIGLVINNNAFSMPPMNVRIQATFEKINSNGETNELAEQDGKVHFSTPIPDDCTLDIRELPLPNPYSIKDGVSANLFNITVFRNGQVYPITDNQMTVTLVLPNQLTGKDAYSVSYQDGEQLLSETQTANANGKLLQYATDHLGNYLVEAHTHNYIWVTDREATATASGIKHEECTICGEKRNENTVIPAIGENHTHTLTYVPAKAATAATAGNSEYWYCPDCGKYFSDAEGKNEITLASTVIAATGNTDGNEVKSPQTGSGHNAALWIMLLVLSGGAGVVLSIAEKKKKAK